MNQGNRHLPPLALAWAIWGLGATLYFIGFYQRVAPAVLTDELTREFALTAVGLGHLSAFYFYSYVAMQIPTGILADRLGPRRLLTAGAAVAALGTALFAFAPNGIAANAGRMLVGASVGVAFVSMLKLASVWLPARHFALSSALAMAVGVSGAVFAGAPLRLMADQFGWRGVMGFSAALTALLALATWAVVRDDPAMRGYASHAPAAKAGHVPHVWADLKAALSDRNVVLLFFIPGTASAIVLTFAGLWGVPFLTTHYAMTPARAASLCSLMMVAWAVGSILFSAASDRMGRRKPLFLGGLALTLMFWSLLIFVRGHSPVTLLLLVTATGFFAGCFIVSFAFAKESGPAHLAGTVSGIANMGVIQGPMFMQPAVGWFLDRQWDGSLVAGKRVFAFAAYQQGFSLMLVWGVISLALLAMTRETYCRQR
ncbi:MAG TPA: MFS transporter [Usitatibacteraceae bacterium]|nr:MFS transporter [Usitatibacteraceae bacterium]